MTATELLPRRKRRKYDRPKYDTDITNYGCWRIFDRKMLKSSDNAAPVVCKISVAPALVKKVFGDPELGLANLHSTGEYRFQDENFSLFLVYDYKTTTD